MRRGNAPGGAQVPAMGRKRAMAMVSLYVPAYNTARTIRQCLEHVFAQTRPPDEVVVVDDGSEDETGAIAARCGVRVVRHEQNRGVGAARNTGLHAVRGDWVATVNADCVPEPQWLETLLRHIGQPGVVGAGGQMKEKFQQSLADRWRAHYLTQTHGTQLLVTPPFLYGSNSVFHREALLSVGGYNEIYRRSFEDVDLSTRMMKAGGRLIYDPAAVVWHLHRDTPLSAVRTMWQWDFFSLPPPTRLLPLLKRLEKNARRTRFFLWRNFWAGNFALLPLDALVLPYHSWLDLRWYWQHRRRRKGNVPPTIESKETR
ncbi:MAG: glycosyltransferase [Abditibacteriales bacterium]|nr:glycosyltransferase [Abditibacteriales bacterium]